MGMSTAAVDHQRAPLSNVRMEAAFTFLLVLKIKSVVSQSKRLSTGSQAKSSPLLIGQPAAEGRDFGQHPVRGGCHGHYALPVWRKACCHGDGR